MAEGRTKVVTGKARLSYANVWEPKAPMGGGDPKYSTAIWIPKSDTVTINKIKAAFDFLKSDPDAAKTWGGKVPANLRLPLRDGDTEIDDRTGAPKVPGHYFLNASSKQQPGIIDRFKDEIMDKSEVYSGCYARVSVTFFPYSTSGNKGIGCGLNHIQKVADGEILGGRSRATDDFDEFLDDDFLS